MIQVSALASRLLAAIQVGESHAGELFLGLGVQSPPFRLDEKLPSHLDIG